jgi:hypothetical protein
LGNYVSAKNTLAEFDAFLTARLAISTLLKMFLHDPLAIWAVIVIVINLTVFGRFFNGVGMVRCHLRHLWFLLGEDGRGNSTPRLAVQQSTILPSKSPTKGWQKKAAQENG